MVDRNLGKLTHQDLGQMQMYVNYFDRQRKTRSAGRNHISQRRQYPCAGMPALATGQGDVATETCGVGGASISLNRLR